LKKIILIFAFCCTAGNADDSASKYSEYFGSYSGCALIVSRDRHGESRLDYGGERCEQRMSPCSTFKIPNALIGLQQGVVDGPAHLKEWDGTIHSREQNNRDHTLASAIDNSVVWYFQSLARDVGTQQMQAWLERLEYGNHDISSGIDRFWLSGSLEISAQEELDFLVSLKHQTLPFRPEVQSQVTEMLKQDSDLPGTLHAKTGSCLGPEGAGLDHGWFIGWVDWDKKTERNPAVTFFVINIVGDEAWGWNAKPIAMKLLEEYQP
jgi:beta-lactamase class D